jgi:hypothetical protein
MLLLFMNVVHVHMNLHPDQLGPNSKFGILLVKVLIFLNIILHLNFNLFRIRSHAYHPHEYHIWCNLAWSFRIHSHAFHPQ